MNPSVHCDDVRELISASRGGHGGLTELALVEAHLSQCPPCRGHLEQLEHSGFWSRLVPASTPLRLAAATLALLSTVLAAYRVVPFFEVGEPPRLQVGASENALPIAAALADSVPTQSSAVTRPSVPAEKPVTIQAKAPPTAATSRESIIARPGAAADPARDRPARAGSSDRVWTSRAVPASTDVLGRLAVKDPGEAHRRLAGLLSGVDATVQDWQQRGLALTEVEVVVPRLKYPGLTQGLAQIGTWRVEAQRSPLPDMVRVTVKVTGS